jgi:hypothetical protein
MLKCIFFGLLVLIFDLRTIFIHIFTTLSVFLSILANMFLFDISLNVATLLQFIMLPAILNEFFVYPTYLFLYISERKRRHVHHFGLSMLRNIFTLSSKSHAATGKINEQLAEWNMPPPERLVARGNFSYARSSRMSVKFLLSTLIFSIMFLAFCQTYNFNALFVLFASTFFNLIVHLYIFYPILLNYFGPNWS